MLFPFFAHAHNDTRSEECECCARKKHTHFFSQSLCECVCANLLERAIFFCVQKSASHAEHGQTVFLSVSCQGKGSAMRGDKRLNCCRTPSQVTHFQKKKKPPTSACAVAKWRSQRQKFNCTCTRAQVAGSSGGTGLKNRTLHSEKKSLFFVFLGFDPAFSRRCCSRRVCV